MSAPRGLATLLCHTINDLRSRLTLSSRLLSLDLTPTHLNLAVSDSTNTIAVPFGLLTRTPKPQADAKILASAFQYTKDDHNPMLQIHALVVNIPPLHAAPIFSYVDKILQIQGVLDDLKGVLLYSEAHVVKKLVPEQHELASAVRALPEGLDKARRGRFVEAMYPRIADINDRAHLHKDHARLAASEVLQTVLNELNKKEDK